MEAYVRLLFGILLSILVSSWAFGQPGLTIDKLDKKSINEAAKEVAYSALLEGTIGDPNQEIWVNVSESGSSSPRSFKATIDETRRDEAGGYRWRAICYFGEFNGRSNGKSYEVSVSAIDKNQIDEYSTLGAFSASSHQTNPITLKRVKN
jgi:hypothetical protein